MRTSVIAPNVARHTPARQVTKRIPVEMPMMQSKSSVTWSILIITIKANTANNMISRAPIFYFYIFHANQTGIDTIVTGLFNPPY